MFPEDNLDFFIWRSPSRSPYPSLRAVGNPWSNSSCSSHLGRCLQLSGISIMPREGSEHLPTADQCRTPAMQGSSASERGFLMGTGAEFSRSCGGLTPVGSSATQLLPHSLTQQHGGGSGKGRKSSQRPEHFCINLASDNSERKYICKCQNFPMGSLQRGKGASSATKFCLVNSCANNSH